jgi:hypothetical protein
MEVCSSSFAMERIQVMKGGSDMKNLTCWRLHAYKKILRDEEETVRQC